MKREQVYDAINSERDYQESNKDLKNSHIVSSFPLSSGILCMEKLLHEARVNWYHEKDPYPASMDLIRKIAAVAVQMGEIYGMKKR